MTANLNYSLTKDGRKGILQERVMFQTPIEGYHTTGRSDLLCRLYEDGTLAVEKGFKWDFGSGAIDTPAMVYASLAHDALCRITNHRLVPWSVRAEADKYFRQLLKRYQPEGGIHGAIGWFSRWYRWAGVSLYSQLIARWRDKQ